ncbi:hypothetical protein BTA49_07610 [Pseudomonas mosselii]|nr:hypothetical protein CLJ08_06010 [Pseudomonas mosselii]ORT71852.1 hypothetical protein BTA49_07610 [Pseudomonas mosselii]
MGLLCSPFAGKPAPAVSAQIPCRSRLAGEKGAQRPQDLLPILQNTVASKTKVVWLASSGSIKLESGSPYSVLLGQKQ